MPCIIKAAATRILFEFQISFFTAPATHYKKIRSLSSIESGASEMERGKKGSDYLNRGLSCVRCDIHQRRRVVEIMEIFIQGEGREFKSQISVSSDGLYRHVDPV